MFSTHVTQQSRTIDTEKKWFSNGPKIGQIMVEFKNSSFSLRDDK